MRPPGPPTEFEIPENFSETAARPANRLADGEAPPRANRQRSARHRWQESVRERPRIELSPEQIEARRVRVEAQEAQQEARLRKCPPGHWGLTAITILLTVISIPLIYSASTSDSLESSQAA